MATINLGKLKFNWAGVYDPGLSYSMDDVAAFRGGAYVCIQDADPGVDPDDDTHWEAMAEGFRWAGAFDAGTGYFRNDLVSQGNSTYICVADAVPGEDPVGTPAKWDVVAQGHATTQAVGDIIIRDADDVEKPLAAGTQGEFLGVGANGVPEYQKVDMRGSAYMNGVTPPVFSSRLDPANQMVGALQNDIVGHPTHFIHNYGHSYQYIWDGEWRENGNGNWASYSAGGNGANMAVVAQAYVNSTDPASGNYGSFSAHGNNNYGYAHYWPMPTQSQNHGQRTGNWSGHYGYMLKLKASPGVHNRFSIAEHTAGWWWGIFLFLLDPANGYSIVKRLHAMAPMTWSNGVPKSDPHLTPFGQVQYMDTIGTTWVHTDIHKDLIAQYADGDGYIYLGLAVHNNSTDASQVRFLGMALTPVYDPGYVQTAYSIYYGLDGWYQAEWAWQGHITGAYFAYVACENNRYPGNTVRNLRVPVFDVGEDLLISFLARNNNANGSTWQAYGGTGLQMIPMHPNTGAYNTHGYIARAGHYKDSPTIQQWRGFGDAAQVVQYVVPKEVVQECLGYGGHGVDDVIQLQCSNYANNNFDIFGLYAQPLENK